MPPGLHLGLGKGYPSSELCGLPSFTWHCMLIPAHPRTHPGLPLSQIYARYWGGNITQQSMHGYGTDMYITLQVGNRQENLTYTPT